MIFCAALHARQKIEQVSRRHARDFLAVSFPIGAEKMVPLASSCRRARFCKRAVLANKIGAPKGN
jgi:hypothetical protein